MASKKISDLKRDVQLLNDSLVTERRRYEIEIKELKDKLESIDRLHLMARTELIKAMSCAMKACSSIMWSEKATGWDFAKTRRP